MDSLCYTKLNRSVQFRKGVKFLGEGNTRIVYLSKSKQFVFKVPKDDYGLSDNYGEAREYRKRTGPFEHNQLARCMITHSGILVMELVEPVKDNKVFLPLWVDFVDCQQVGYNRAGALVAYDWYYTYRG
jgi:hypothetical protein